MKKVIIYIFLLLANVALVAHTIIPHHHCDSAVVCVTVTETDCCEDDAKHNHQHDAEKHSHEGTGPNACIIDGAYIPQSSQLSNSSDNFNVQLPILFCLCHTNPIVDITQLETQPIEPVPYLISYHSVFITHSLGLRAPPAC